MNRQAATDSTSSPSRQTNPATRSEVMGRVSSCPDSVDQVPRSLGRYVAAMIDTLYAAPEPSPDQLTREALLRPFHELRGSA
jgi:hypothetical protein